MTTSRKPVEVTSHRSPPRMEAFASLPVFFQLKGRKVLVAGGTDAAAWKAELLAAAGAEVHVHAEALGTAMEKLLRAESVSGTFVHHAIRWGAGSFDSVALAVADAETEEQAEAFFLAAKAAGVPVNVIDNPPFCEFQFGSIVNRSPVVIGISTNGAAPILGQAIRRRIETLLPLGLADWAGLAQSVRSAVMDRLAPGPQRRRFWERFTELAFSGREMPTEHDKVSDLVDTVSRAEPVGQGRVTLVGAGPGCAEHLTLKAVRALQGADVILFDDLVSDEVLELARREAKRMLVGKRGGLESCRQEDINATMVSLAKKGKNVVRLKSGDPMVFGRAGEEIERLKEEGIPVSVVPGITAASAMASELGVSLTHRDHAQSVRFVTGHSRKGVLPETVDWTGLTDPATTNVFYMGARMAGRISARLIANGMPPETPVVAMANISRSNEARWSGHLKDLETGVQDLPPGTPILIGVGPVFGINRQQQQMKPFELRAAGAALT
jgi:uroporphyrin-III C-methyltransferase/precorrin-2 dehydrogenase/sirohydrochlorin ferrochelatase